MGWRIQMRSISCLFWWNIFTSALAIEREHSRSKHETWFWEPFDPDLSGATSFKPHDDHIIASNVYFHINRFYSLIDATNTSTSDDTTFHNIQLSKNFAHNSAITPLPLTNVPNFLTNIKSGWVSGTTLLLPFPEIDSPHHMGYWMEILAPVYSYLSNNSTSHIRTVLIPNLSRGTAMSSSCVMDIIKIATTGPSSNDGKENLEQKVGEGEKGSVGRPLVRILFWDDLENTPLNSWLGFESILHVYSRYTSEIRRKDSSGVGDLMNKEKNGFASAEIADNFRFAVHKATGIPPLVPGAPTPLTITYLMPTDSSGITNNKQVLDALQQAAAAAAPAAANTAVSGVEDGVRNKRIAVRPYSPTPSVPLASLIAVMSRTGLLIGRHAPLLANAAFLPPGAAVVEILPYNWNSGGRSEIYRKLTASRTNNNTKEIIIHVAWRAPSGDWMRYESVEDSRYSSWTPVECSSEHCIDAHARAGVEVNVEEFKKIVDDVLRVVYSGSSTSVVSSLKKKLREQYPWPGRVELTGTSGLWWDRGS